MNQAPEVEVGDATSSTVCSSIMQECKSLIRSSISSNSIMH